MQGEATGIQELDEFVHHHRDAGGIPAFNDNYHRYFFIPEDPSEEFPVAFALVRYPSETPCHQFFLPDQTVQTSKDPVPVTINQKN